MILELVLVSSLSGVPQSFILDAPRVASLAIPREDLPDLPVDDLTTKELSSEQKRLTENEPSTIGAKITLGVGGGLALGCGAMSLASASTPYEPPQGLFSLSQRQGLGIGAFLLGIAAVVVGLTGAAILISKTSRRDEYLARRAAVNARLDAVAAGRLDSTTPETVLTADSFYEREYELILDQRPTLGLPVGLLLGGSGLLIAGGVHAMLPSNLYQGINGSGTDVTAAAAVGAGSAVVVAGVVFLVTRLRRRAVIDERLQQLRDAAQSAGSLVPSSEPSEQLSPPPLPVAATF